MNTRDEDKGLSTSERILQLQAQWDEIAGSAENLDLTPEQLGELQRRLDDHRRDPRHYRTWEEVRAELMALGRHASD